MSRGRRAVPWALAACALLAPRPAAAADPELEPLPRPRLEHLEERVRLQLESARDRLDQLAGPPPAARGELAEIYGELGRLYLLFDISDLASAAFRNALRLAPGDVRWDYFLAVLHTQNGETGEAIRRLERVREERPDDLAVLLRVGRLQLDAGRDAEARAAYRRALELEPASAAAHAGLGELAFRAGDDGLAVEHFTRALELQPEADAIHHRLGLAYRRQGDLERARQHLALNRGGQVRFPDPLIEEMGALIRSPKALFSDGVKALRAEEFERALELFELALGEDPNDHLIHNNLGLVLHRLGRRDEAEVRFREALELDPGFRNGHFNLALLLAEEGRFEEAAPHFEEAHRIDPQDRRGHLEWATVLSRIGQPERAAAELEKLLEARPDDPEAVLKLGAIQAQLGRGEAARATLRRVLELDAKPAQRAEAERRLGLLAEEAGDLEKAIAHYRGAAELAPGAVEPRIALGRALGRGGRFAEAAESFGAAVELDPEPLEPHFGRGMALILAGRYPAARQALEASLARHAGALPITHLLARLLASCPDPAVRDGARALALAGEVMQRQQTLEHAETLAMALAESGRFEEAVGWQRRIVEELERGAPPPVVDGARRRLEAYQRREPARSPWGSPG